MAAATTSMRGERKIKPSNAPMISIVRLLTNSQERSGVDRKTSIGWDPNMSNPARAMEVRMKSAINQASTPSSSQAAIASSTRPSPVRAAAKITRPTEYSCKLLTSSEIGSTAISMVLTISISEPESKRNRSRSSLTSSDDPATITLSLCSPLATRLRSQSTTTRSLMTRITVPTSPKSNKTDRLLRLSLKKIAQPQINIPSHSKAKTTCLKDLIIVFCNGYS